MEVQAMDDLGEREHLKRVIGKVGGDSAGPVIVFIGSVHGNEPAGYLALEQLVTQLEQHQPHLRGTVYAIGGNLDALEKKMRYVEQDLNRMWTKERIQRLAAHDHVPVARDDRQQVEIWNLLEDILNDHDGPFYFIDLHTTSSDSIPFVVVNDSLINRQFTELYPLPIILGIEEYLEGPLLSYVNELGYVAFGFEGGQHDDPLSVQHHLSFARLAIHFCGMLDDRRWPVVKDREILRKASRGVHSFYEIFFRYQIRDDEDFTMYPGYKNFEKIKLGQQLATSDGKPILADRNARVFMPLYQAQGSDGFFAIRPIPKLFLRLSSALRVRKADRLLTWLPGVNWATEKREALVVDRRIARFMTKQFFHLLGYRSIRNDRHHYVMQNREAASRYKEYRQEPWF